MLTKEGSLKRQERLRSLMADQNVDAIVLTDLLEIYYFTGILYTDRYPSFMYLERDGGSWIVAQNAETVQCVDEVLTFPWQIGFTTNPKLWSDLGSVVKSKLGTEKKLKRLAWQAESMPKQLAELIDECVGQPDWIAFDDDLNKMQEVKDADEIEVMCKAIQADLAAYDAAQQAIEPGVSELEVLAAAQEAAHLAAGEKVFHDGDYQCGVPGGFARDRKIEKGEVYIIDAWTIYRGYWADLCRAFVVGGEPTDLQQSVFDHLKAFHEQVPDYLQPGKDGSEIFHAMEVHIKEHPALTEAGLIHHAGHCVGLRPHQMPDLNGERGGTLQVGNVVSVEPGAYIPDVRGGVRLENMYLITEDGLQNLSEYPIEIVPKK